MPACVRLSVRALAWTHLCFPFSRSFSRVSFFCTSHCGPPGLSGLRLLRVRVLGIEACSWFTRCTKRMGSQLVSFAAALEARWAGGGEVSEEPARTAPRTEAPDDLFREYNARSHC